MKNYLVLLAMMAVGAQLYAQQPAQVYFPQNDVAVNNYLNKPIISAWSGGMNNPQPCLADLNKDGKKDLVIYEHLMGVETYINTGGANNPVYTYTPQYEGTFPPVYHFLKLIDYNGDGVPDLFNNVLGGNGISVWRGKYVANQLSFDYYKELRYLTGGSGWVNTVTQPNGIPGAIDVDGDGDLDFFSYDVGGSVISYYRNCQKEDGLPADSIRVCLKDECWGRVYQWEQRWQELNITCGKYNLTCNKTTKTTNGVNTLCMGDFDADGDIDYFNGNSAFSDIQYLTNGKKDLGAAIDTMTAQDTSWTSNGHKMLTNQYPAAFYMDLDQDKLMDLVFAPHAKSTEDYKTLVFYRNTGTTSAPSYTWQTDAYLVDQMIDYGSVSHPVFYDYDRDGKPDLFAGSAGMWPDNKSKLAYYGNTTTGTNRSLKEISTNFQSLDTLNLKGIAPAFGDLDNDGKDDMVLGLGNGTLLFFTNKAASNSQTPIWIYDGTFLKDANNAGIDVGYNATPFIYDINKDGKPDLLVGNQGGGAYYYENNSAAANTTNLKLITTNLGGIKIQKPGFINGYSSFYIGHTDDAGGEYLVAGTYQGVLQRYKFDPAKLTGKFDMVDSPYSRINVYGYSHPAIADMDGDGKYEMVLGNELGGLKLYRQLYSLGVGNNIFDDEHVSLYPNPANNNFRVEWNAMLSGTVHISLVNVTGQQISQQDVTNDNSATIDVQQLATGVYYCILQSGGNRIVKPVTVVR